VPFNGTSTTRLGQRIVAAGGETVLAGGGRGTVILVDVDAPASFISFTGHTTKVASVAALSDGRIVAGADDGTILIWSQDQPDSPSEVGRHGGEVVAIVELDDGRLVTAANGLVDHSDIADGLAEPLAIRYWDDF